MNIQTFQLGPLNTNCYLVTANDDDTCLVIDPGGSADTVSAEIVRQNLKLQAIAATHGHYDHILGANELQLAFAVPFLVHQQDQFLVKEIRQRAQHWTQREIVEQPPEMSQFLTDGQELSLGSQKLEVMHTPGHTPGGVCLVNGQEKIVFTGDTVFADGVGRTDLSYSSAADLKQSLKKIRSQLQGFHAYPGHGQDFYL